MPNTFIERANRLAHANFLSGVSPFVFGVRRPSINRGAAPDRHRASQQQPPMLRLLRGNGDRNKKKFAN
jgi:hypothetical protein